MNEYQNQLQEVLSLLDLRPGHPYLDYSKYEGSEFINAFHMSLSTSTPKETIKNIINERLSLKQKFDSLGDKIKGAKFKKAIKHKQVIDGDETVSRDRFTRSLELPILNRMTISEGSTKDVKIKNEMFFTYLRLIEIIFNEHSPKLALDQFLEDPKRIVSFFSSNDLQSHKSIIKTNPNLIRSFMLDSLNLCSFNENDWKEVFIKGEPNIQHDSSWFERLVIAIQAYNPKILTNLTAQEIMAVMFSNGYSKISKERFEENFRKIKSRYKVIVKPGRRPKKASR